MAGVWSSASALELSQDELFVCCMYAVIVTVTARITDT